MIHKDVQKRYSNIYVFVLQHGKDLSSNTLVQQRLDNLIKATESSNEKLCVTSIAK
jgi:hypothetical protein